MYECLCYDFFHSQRNQEIIWYVSTQPTPSRIGECRFASRRGTVVVVYGQSVHADRALALASQLAVRRGSELVVLIDADAQSFQALEAAARAQLEAVKAEAKFETMGPGELTALKAALKRHRGGLLVMASDCRLIEGRQDQLSSLDIPVLLARNTAR